MGEGVGGGVGAEGVVGDNCVPGRVGRIVGGGCELEARKRVSERAEKCGTMKHLPYAHKK